MEKILINATVCFFVRPGRVLLAMKKRGFSAGYWNGYGGEPEPGEAVSETAIREVWEESGGVVVKPESLEKVAEIDFYFPQKPEWDQRVHAFFVRTWVGEPTETEEMRPQEFDIKDIPWGEMWPEDKLWIPRVLAGEKLRGRMTFRDLKGHAESSEFSTAAF